MKERTAAPRQAAPQTIVDRLVSAFSPAAGLQRLAARTMLDAATGQGGGYKGGRKDRRSLRNWKPPVASADADLLPDLPDLRQRHRDLVRNVPLATGAVATNVTCTVGAGLVLDAAVDPEALGIDDATATRYKRENEREWALFCASADFSRVQHFNALQALVDRATLDGDCFVVRRYRQDSGDAYGTKLQILEADRVSNPDRAADTDRVVAGVEVDGDGVPVAYHVSDKHPGTPRLGSVKWERIAARTGDGRPTILHLFSRERPEQTRGIPYLAPVIEDFKKLGDYKDNELTAADVASRYTVFVTSPDPGEVTPIAGEKPEATAGAADNEVELGSGSIIGLDPGEKIEIANGQRPSPLFDPFVQAMCRQIGVALQLPFELLIKHFTASYTASKAAMELAFQYFICRRQGAPTLFCQTAYEWMMEEAVASGRLNRPGYFNDPMVRAAYCGARWIGPPRFSLDPLKDANADEKDLANGTRTREEICLTRTGGDWATKHKQLTREQQVRDAAGLTPAPVGQASAASDPAVADGGSDAENETQPRRSAS